MADRGNKTEIFVHLSEYRLPWRQVAGSERYGREHAYVRVEAGEKLKEGQKALRFH